MPNEKQSATGRVRGTVKWFSEEKGYGFIVGDDDIERYFHVRNIEGADLPGNGDRVSFQHIKNKKGARADSVRITEKKAKEPRQEKSDDRPKCENCGRRMVPRMVFHEGEPHYSICPFCAATYQKFSACFIATAVYGDYNAAEVVTLRYFRDKILSKYELGRSFIRIYYRRSPPIARWLKKHHFVSYIVKILLNFLVFLINNIYMTKQHLIRSRRCKEIQK